MTAKGITNMNKSNIKDELAHRYLMGKIRPIVYAGVIFWAGWMWQLLIAFRYIPYSAIILH